MQKLKKSLTIFSLILIISAGAVLPVAAKVFDVGGQQKNIFVAENELVPYNFIAAGGLIEFNGEAQKDVIVAGGTVNITGPVHGDVIVGGGNVRIDGNVDGNVRALGGTIEINGKVGKNVTVGGVNVTLGKDSEVGWDVMIGGGNAVLKGKVAGNVNVGAGSLTLGGEVGGNVEAYIGEEGDLNVLPSAKINGSLKYWSIKEAAIPDGAVISGEVTHNSTLSKMVSKNKKQFYTVYLLGIVISIFSTLVIGLIIINLFKEQTKNITGKMLKQPFSSLGWGIVYLIIIPIIALLFLIFVITIPLSVIIMLFYGLALYLTKIFVAILLGWQIFKLYKKTHNGEQEVETKDEKKVLTKSMVVGVIVYILIINIPFVGWLIGFLGMIWALGAMGRVVSEWVEKRVKNEKGLEN